MIFSLYPHMRFILTTLIIGISLSFPIAFAQSTTSSPFKDVKLEHTNYLSITFLQQEGIINGYEDGTFRPNQLVNRAEALKIILEGSRKEVTDSSDNSLFSDVKSNDWFSKYIHFAKSLGIVNGNPDGTFAPGRNVRRAEFLKMLLLTNKFKPEKWLGDRGFKDVSVTDWFSPYMNYAGTAGLLVPEEDRYLRPGKELTRGEVAEILYIMNIILRGDNVPFLLAESERQMLQIEIYIKAKNVFSAKRTAELAVDLTQQAYKANPENTVILSAAKLARAYDLLVTAYMSAIEKNLPLTEHFAGQAKTKATEAWEINHDVQRIARHIKDSADSITDQLKKEINTQNNTQ